MERIAELPELLCLMGKNPVLGDSGDALRNLAILRAANRVTRDVDLLTLPQPERSDVVQAQVDRIPVRRLEIVGEPVGTYLASPRNRVFAAARGYYGAPGRAKAVRQGFREVTSNSKYDGVVLSQLFLAPLVGESDLPIIYDSHNVHHLRLQESLSKFARLPRLYKEKAIAATYSEELTLLRRSALVIACSDRDADVYRAMDRSVPIEVIPNGTLIDQDRVVQDRGSDVGRPLFLASLDYSANTEALEYLLHEVVPRLPASIRIDVAGSNASSKTVKLLEAHASRINWLGRVDDSRETMRRAAGLLVPLLSGGGTRLKVLEGFSTGTPVVSSSKGVEGLPVEDGKHVLIGDTPEDFARHIETVAQSNARLHTICDAARQLVERHYSWGALERTYAGLLSKHLAL